MIVDLQQRKVTNPADPIPYGDPSAKIWGLYLSQAAKFDKEYSDSLKSNADQLLVFLGLLSATVASFTLVSYQQLQPNSSDTTNLLLSQISQQLSALSNGTPTPVSLTLPADPSSFEPTASAVRVNALWFSSLAISMASAVWITLVQQWTRRYLRTTDDGGSYGPPKRARIRAFFTEGAQKFGLGAAIEVLPALLHFSVLLFCIGLVDFLLNINHTVGLTLLSLFTLVALMYLLLTVMPLYFHDSPYQTPLSAIVWYIVEAAPLFTLWLRRKTEAVQYAIQECRDKIGKGMRRALEKTAVRLDSQVDARALRWTLMSLGENRELEKEFLDGLPGLFHQSTHYNSPGFKGELEVYVYAVADNLFRTCMTDLLPEEVRRHRLAVCLRAIWCFSSTVDRHFRAVLDRWAHNDSNNNNNNPWGPLSTETWTVAATMTMDPNALTAIRAHCIQALIAVMQSKGKWQCPPSEAIPLLLQQLDAPSVDAVERWYSRGDHLQLAVAANLLSKVLPLLPKLGIGVGALLKFKLKAILDTMCGELDTSDLPDDLRARFVDGAEVVSVFLPRDMPRGRRRRLDVNGPWTKIFTPVENEGGD